MFRKTALFIVFISFITACDCALAKMNGDDNGGSDEVISLRKETPLPVSPAAAPVTATVDGTAAAALITAAVQETVTPAGTSAAQEKVKLPVKKGMKNAGEAAAIQQPVTATAGEKPLAGQEEINDLVYRIKTKQAGRKAMTCDIVIKTSYTGAAGPQEVKGSVMIKKKDKFRVHYTEPTEQLMVSNGKTLWVYTPGLKQVIKQAVKDANLDTDFYIEIENSIEYFVNNSKTIMTQDDNTYTLSMIPKDRKTLDFDEINVRIEKAGLIPQYMNMKYEGSLMEVIFSNIVNFSADEAAKAGNLKDKDFEFKTPAGTDEIEASALIDAATGK